jgi:Zn-dependent protease with chaperone function
MAAGKWQPGQLGVVYTILLLLFSTIIYAIVAALLIGSAALTVMYVTQGAWVGVVVLGIIFLITVMSLFAGRRKIEGTTATRERFPRLFAALDDVSAKMGAPVPHRVVLTPLAEAYVYEHHPLHRFFRRELVLGLGAGALPLLSEVELKAILAHELAHYGFGHVAFAAYYGRAEAALRNFIGVLLDAVGAQARTRHRVYRITRRSASGVMGEPFSYFGSLIVRIVTLPLEIILIVFHLLRLAESRAMEFDVDRAAALAYGPQTFANGLMSLLVAARTIRGSFTSLRTEMAKHGERSFYAQMRLHYAELPPSVMYKLRIEAVRGFRTLEQTHPCTVDRLRAAYTVPFVPTATPEAPVPAVALLVPSGEADATSVERELTEQLFEMADTQGRRGGRRR